MTRSQPRCWSSWRRLAVAESAPFFRRSIQQIRGGVFCGAVARTLAALAGAHRLIKRPRAKSERIEPAPCDMSSVRMWCDDGTVSIGSGFAINHIGGVARRSGASSRVAFCLDRGRSRRNNPASRRNHFPDCAKTRGNERELLCSQATRESAHVDAHQSILPRLLPGTSVRDAEVQSWPLRPDDTGAERERHCRPPRPTIVAK
jgi:hypothetical protein